MNLNELHDTLVDETIVDPEKVAIKNDKNGKYIFLDEFVIRQNSNGTYDVSDNNNELESFNETAQNIVKFFTGFFDAFHYDAYQVKNDDYYENGFDFCLDTQDGEDEDESEEETEETDEEETEDDGEESEGKK